ncbi:sigma-54 interaction domain-containing protein [Anaerosinus gibii]|uniref:HTH-type transcriptional regulatory protein TyrR n=1 Tax=Selenobaculum gibii TaxID=3054208 RepID=A0A9Y2AI43_9FIRM|nr:sigma 54-interacting transcriptional regulator [Selenobaculum gbiensis]WIW70529.1 sigma 54-interacting transcriptional regulator [Selenobaculum gbiensis]
MLRNGYGNSWSASQLKIESSETRRLREEYSNAAFTGFIGKSPEILRVLNLAEKAAQVQSTVLICGESGTGKEVIAEGIHLAGERALGPMIKVNCSAIPETLLESELFGHEKGAFTGAIKNKLGKFELADKGTIFLDEIGEMDIRMQCKLLRVLQNKTFDRVGGENSICVDVRIIAATNQDMVSLIAKGEFRADLYYRLNVIPIYLPSLVQRKTDILLLAEHFLHKYAKVFNKSFSGFSEEAMRLLLQYNWPGNVRELQNIVERAVVLTDHSRIEASDLEFDSYNRIEKSKPNPIYQSIVQGELLTLEEYEKQIITAALDRFGSYTAAGKALGITHKTVAAKAQKYGINFEREARV